MALTGGARLGSYEIVAPLGAGGMGEVYRARDTKLNRDVAIKVLLPAVANDPDRLARFSREAQVLASLNHPNIAHIYGIEDAAIVMELVEGEDLAQRIARGPIPLDEALPIARQIAEALEAAHDHGIIHRDLKPANIKVRADGTVKVLDFGLAKAIDPTAGSSNIAMNSPTLSIHATEAGLILGTAAYMSPEQAAGKVVDKRSDLWAFGVVLFEMLTGRQVFAGETVSHVLAAVLKDEPDWAALPPHTPESIRRLLRRCLEKDRKRRCESAADARLEIDDAIHAPQPSTREKDSNRGLQWALGMALIVAASGIAAAVWIAQRNSSTAVRGEVVRFSIHDTDQVIVSRAPRDMAISPDGRQLAFVGFGEGGARIWVRGLDALQARPVAGTEGVMSLCWSPDSTSLAFAALGKIKTVPVAGGPAQAIAVPRINAMNGFAWGPDGTIVYSGLRGVWAVNASGGAPADVLPIAADETYDSLAFLPDGRHFLMAVRSADPGKAGTFAVTADGATRRRILDFPTAAQYAMARLIYVREGILYGQRFDPAQLRLDGEAESLGESVSESFSASDQGAIAYLPLAASRAGASTRLTWMDRSGRVVERIDQTSGASGPTLSLDGSRLAMVLRGDIWVLELARAVLSRVTSAKNGASNFSPTWLPDNQRIMFHRSRFRNGQDAILSVAIGNAADETVVFQPAEDAGIHAHPTDISANGRYLAYETGNLETGDNGTVWVKALGTDVKASLHGGASSSQTEGIFSPDGRWLSYTSDSSGRFEVYVDAVPNPSSRVQVSGNGGHSARWSRDGKELFYVTLDGTMIAMPIRATQPLEFGRPVTLFPFISSTRGLPGGKPAYDVAPDGQRFVVNTVLRQTDPSLQVLLNWPALLKKPN